jgi:hypothetical protein
LKQLEDPAAETNPAGLSLQTITRFRLLLRATSG